MPFTSTQERPCDGRCSIGTTILRLFHYCLRLVDGDPVVGRINTEQDLRMMRRRDVRKRISGGYRSLLRRQLGLILFRRSTIIWTGDKALVTSALHEEFPIIRRINTGMKKLHLSARSRRHRVKVKAGELLSEVTAKLLAVGSSGAHEPRLGGLHGQIQWLTSSTSRAGPVGGRSLD